MLREEASSVDPRVTKTRSGTVRTVSMKSARTVVGVIVCASASAFAITVSAFGGNAAPVPDRGLELRTSAVTSHATVALVTTREFRVAAVATPKGGGSAPTAEVRVAVARRVAGGWRETHEVKLPETYFWRTFRARASICRLAIATSGRQPSFRPYAEVQILLSPSIGCGGTHRIPLAGA